MFASPAAYAAGVAPADRQTRQGRRGNPAPVRRAPGTGHGITDPVGEAGGGDAEEARGLDIEGEDRSWDGK